MIVALASNKIISSANIKDRLSLQISPRTIRRYLSDSEHLKYSKLISKPPLTQDHKLQRLDFSKLHLTWNRNWDDVIFSDEKKFNLDVPDGFQYYWHDLRKDKKVFLKKSSGRRFRNNLGILLKKIKRSHSIHKY